MPEEKPVEEESPPVPKNLKNLSAILREAESAGLLEDDAEDEAKEENVALMKGTKFCQREGCGKEFQPTANNQKFCPGCAAIVKRDRYAKLVRANNPGGPTCKHHPDRPAHVSNTGYNMGLCLDCITEIRRKAAKSRGGKEENNSLPAPGLVPPAPPTAPTDVRGLILFLLDTKQNFLMKMNAIDSVIEILRPLG